MVTVEWLSMELLELSECVVSSGKDVRTVTKDKSNPTIDSELPGSLSDNNYRRYDN